MRFRGREPSASSYPSYIINFDCCLLLAWRDKETSGLIVSTAHSIYFSVLPLFSFRFFCCHADFFFVVVFMLCRLQTGVVYNCIDHQSDAIANTNAWTFVVATQMNVSRIVCCTFVVRCVWFYIRSEVEWGVEGKFYWNEHLVMTKIRRGFYRICDVCVQCAWVHLPFFRQKIHCVSVFNIKCYFV